MQRKCLLESGLIIIFLKESREGVCETFLKEQVQFEDENPEKKMEFLVLTLRDIFVEITRKKSI